MREYTLEDLMYEYHIVKEKDLYQKQLDEEEADKIEEAKIQEDLDWADMMEAEEEAERLKKESKAKEAEVKKKAEQYDPSKDPKNIEWMEKHIEENKLFFGEDFGDDVNLSFDSDPKDK